MVHADESGSTRMLLTWQLSFLCVSVAVCLKTGLLTVSFCELLPRVQRLFCDSYLCLYICQRQTVFLVFTRVSLSLSLHCCRSQFSDLVESLILTVAVRNHVWNGEDKHGYPVYNPDGLPACNISVRHPSVAVGLLPDIASLSAYAAGSWILSVTKWS